MKVQINKYGYTRNGVKIEPPNGWKLLSEGERIPSIHREFSEVYNGREDRYETIGWLDPRRCRSTVTAITACIWGWIRAYAVPE